MNSPSIILQGISLQEFESLIRKLIAERKDEVLQTKYIPAQKETDYLTREQVSKRLKISLPTLSKYTNAGLIQSYKIGSRVLYKMEHIEEALQLVNRQKFKSHNSYYRKEI